MLVFVAAACAVPQQIMMVCDSASAYQVHVEGAWIFLDECRSKRERYTRTHVIIARN